RSRHGCGARRARGCLPTAHRSLWPNKALEPTPSSLRSCVATAVGRGSPLAFGSLCSSRGEKWRQGGSQDGIRRHKETAMCANVSSHSRRRRMLLKINDLFHSTFVNIKPIESTTYAFYAVRNAASFELSC